MEKIESRTINIAAGLALLIILAGIVYFVDMRSIKLPPSPVLTTSTDTSGLANKTQEIKNYSDLVSTIQKSHSEVYRLVVIDVFLALLKVIIAAGLTFTLGSRIVNAVEKYSLAKLNKSNQKPTDQG